VRGADAGHGNADEADEDGGGVAEEDEGEALAALALADCAALVALRFFTFEPPSIARKLI